MVVISSTTLPMTEQQLQDQRYILKDRQPVACKDEAEWREFMRNPGNVLVARDSVNPFEVITIFLGFNHRTAENPIFFQTSVLGVDDHSHENAETWEQATSNHNRLLKAVGYLKDHIVREKSGTNKSFKPVETTIYQNEIHFRCVSEQAAIDGLPESGIRWKRRGDTIIYVAIPSSLI